MSKGRWSDLVARLGSAVVMAAVGAAAMWMGGWVFAVVVGAVSGLMVWELLRMMGVTVGWAETGLALLCAALVMVLPVLPWVGLVGLALFAVLCWMAAQDPPRATLFAGMIAIAGAGMVLVRNELGFLWLLWFVAVVVLTDVGGYFGGKLVGGPKFWPAISPKKTWAGVITGWVCAALTGVLFGLNSGVMLPVVLVSLLLSFTSQMGDIAESALKRRFGEKDSSGLIPGHGGVFDRFDGMMGASLALLLIALIFGFPMGLFA